MGPRFVFTAFFLAFAFVITFAAVTTVRHVNAHTSTLVLQSTRG